MTPRPLIPIRATALPLCLLMLLLLLGFSGPVWAGNEPKVGIFGDVHLGPGEVVYDDLVCIGGSAVVEGRVHGDVVVVMGDLEFSGEAENVVSVLSATRLEAGAVIHDELVHVLGKMERDPSVEVGGQVVDLGSRLPPHVQAVLSKGIIGIFVFFRVLSLVISLVVILLVTLLAPTRIERMSFALDARWPAALGFGLLGIIGTGILCVILFITLIGIPIAVVLGLVVKVLGAMGVAAMMAVLGRRLGSSLGLTGPGTSVLALVLIGFAVVAVVRFIPIVGEVGWLILSILGLGLALVTKLGSPTVGTASEAPPPAPATAGSVS